MARPGISLVTNVNRYWADTASLDDLKEANRSQNARTILTGSKRVVNGKWRISLRLVNAATGDALLTEALVVNRDHASAIEALRKLIRPIWSILEQKDWSGLSLQSRDPGLEKSKRA
jgi:TolB-like protein